MESRTGAGLSEREAKNTAPQLKAAPPMPASRVQRRIVWVLSTATVLGGLGVGASLSAGSLLIVDVTGNEGLSGLGSTMNAVGAAIAGIPLARFAASRGRRVALASGSAIAMLGALCVILAAANRIGSLLFVGLAVLGIASAVQLQSRFAATDLAVPKNRARDLSLVVWSITIGAVIGPNLITPGETVGAWLGIPPLSGIFVFTIGAQLAAGLVNWYGLRPDPLLESRRIADAEARETAARPRVGGDAVLGGTGTAPVTSALPQFLAILIIAAAHATMVALMSMTPLHIMHHGGSVTIVGLTLSLHIAGMYALSPVFGMAASRLGRLPVVLAGFAVLGLAALGVGLLGESMLAVQISLILLGIGWSMVNVAGSALVTEVTPLALRPRRQGQADTTMNAAGAVFGALAGVVFAGGGFPWLASVVGVLIVGGFAAGIMCGRISIRPAA